MYIFYEFICEATSRNLTKFLFEFLIRKRERVRERVKY